jgi:4-hydroxybenzoate polyprenyltransferase
MMVWGMMMPLCGAPLSSLLGLCLALQLGLFSGVFETIQVMRDADADAAAGVRTTGVALGRARTLWLGRALMLAASSYALLVMQPVAAGISAMALLVPSHPQRVERYWTHVKMIYGVAWLLICVWVFFHARSAGVLFSVARTTGYG